jgi:hypothetical protein
MGKAVRPHSSRQDCLHCDGAFDLSVGRETHATAGQDAGATAGSIDEELVILIIVLIIYYIMLNKIDLLTNISYTELA